MVGKQYRVVTEKGNRFAGTFNLAWCTTWWRRIETIAPLVGLPSGLPAVPLPRWSGHDRPFRCAPKTPHVRRFANGRPMAWLDDDFLSIDADCATVAAPETGRSDLTLRHSARGGGPPDPHQRPLRAHTSSVEQTRARAA